MIKMITYPLNNIDYTAEDAELYFSTRESGIYDGNDFEVTVSGSDNYVTVGTGIAWIHNTKFSGKVVASKEPKTLTLSLPNSVYDRIDAIVIQFDANENATDIIVKEGVASSVPVAPTVVRTESLYELHIYQILRKAGAAVIGIDDLIDLRNNSNYCGIMFDPISSIDATLEKSGYAADAKIVGDAINSMQNETVPISRGGTGANTAENAWEALGGGTIGKKNALSASDIPNHSTSKLTSGTLPIGRGGTGATTVAGVLENFGLSDAVTGQTVWTNASPTSSFAAQSVEVYSTTKDILFWVIEFAYSTAMPTYKWAEIVPAQDLTGENGAAIRVVRVHSSDPANVVYRIVTAYADSVFFEGGFKNGTADNTAAIPFRISVIRKV